MEEHKKFMNRAIELSEKYSFQYEGGPFGCVIVKDGEIIAEGWNSVLKNNDPTAHAEMEAIRKAGKKLNNFSLKGSILYTSCEPCPMCLAAIYWARIDTVYFANSQEEAKKISFDDSFIYEEIEKSKEERQIHMIRIQEKEAWEVFESWDNWEGKQTY